MRKLCLTLISVVLFVPFYSFGAMKNLDSMEMWNVIQNNGNCFGKWYLNASHPGELKGDGYIQCGSETARFQLRGISTSENVVNLHRRYGSDGIDCDYYGEINPQKNRVVGKYRCSNHGIEKAWEATIGN